jgi:hypothetical protein
LIGVLKKAMPFFLLVLLVFGDAKAEPVSAIPDLPWKGERLVFELSWFAIKAGTAVMEVSEREDRGRKAYQISAVTASNEYIDIIYKVRDRIDSFVYADNLSSYKYKVHQEEGFFRRDKEIIFDYDKKEATYTKDKKTSVHSIPAFVQDSLSSLYYLRTKELTVGKPVIIDVFDNKKLWQVEVQVLKKERIETAAGVFDTVQIKPILKFEGIFQRKGDVYIWLTDDSRKMPVKMKSKIKIGSISADLIEYKNSR